MSLEKSALVTGAGSGIGRALAFKLADRGYAVTAVDVCGESATAVAAEIQRRGGSAHASVCDITDNSAQERVFDEHVSRFGGLHVACLNAGVLELGNVLSRNPGRWEATLDIDLRAQIMGTRLAVRAMEACKAAGVILVTASAASVWPMPEGPVYAAAKAGLMNFVRSMATRLALRGLRICAICPQVVDTPMASLGREKLAAAESRGEPMAFLSTPKSKPLTVERVVQGAMYLLDDDTKHGTALVMLGEGRVFENSFHKATMRVVTLEPGKQTPPQLISKDALTRWAMQPHPAQRSRIEVYRLSENFRAATRVVKDAIPEPKAGEVLIKRMFAGVNASDVNFTSGRYFASPEKSAKLLPFDAGFEAVGVVAALGPGVKGLELGDPVAEMTFGAYSTFGTLQAKHVMKIQTCAAEVLALLTSGLTASIGLAEAAQMRTHETVLVTAAAGGTGQFVVQLAKAAGNHVIATCGGADKAGLLKQLGADRVINYHEEKVADVLKREYKKGVNIVWETVGGDMFETCVKALAPKGRLIVVGMMSQYASGWKPSVSKGLLELLLTRSASVRGFFLPHHAKHFKEHLSQLTHSWTQGKLHVSLSPIEFKGVESVMDAVEHLQSGKSIGKVIVQICDTLPDGLPAAKL